MKLIQKSLLRVFQSLCNKCVCSSLDGRFSALPSLIFDKSRHKVGCLKYAMTSFNLFQAKIFCLCVRSIAMQCLFFISLSTSSNSWPSDFFLNPRPNWRRGFCWGKITSTIVWKKKTFMLFWILMYRKTMKQNRTTLYTKTIHWWNS